MKPFDPTLNAAIATICTELFPDGFDTTDDETFAPSTLDAVTRHYETTGRMLVWSGASDGTIYGDPAVNHMARAWHDWCHYAGQFPFDLAGEACTCELQQRMLEARFGHNPLWHDLLEAEVIAQARLYEFTGKFPADQRQFVASYVGIDNY